MVVHRTSIRNVSGASEPFNEQCGGGPRAFLHKGVRVCRVSGFELGIRV